MYAFIIHPPCHDAEDPTGQIKRESKVQIPLWMAYILIFSYVDWTWTRSTHTSNPIGTVRISRYRALLTPGYRTRSRQSPQASSSQG